jgi:Ca-activated chloride channel homolog
MNPNLRKWLGRISFYGCLIAATVALAWAYMNYVHWPQRDALTFTDHAFWSAMSWVPGLDTSAYTHNPPVQYDISGLRWLALLCGLPLLALIDRFSLTDLPVTQRAFNVLVRALLITALVGSLLNLQRTDFDQAGTATVLLVDVSESMPDKALADARAYLQTFYDARGPRDTLRLITFSKRPHSVRLGNDAQLPPLTRHLPDDPSSSSAASSEQPNQHTNIQAALQLAYSMYPPDTLRRAILISDGNQTEGDLLAESLSAKAYNVKLFTHHLDIQPLPELMIRSVSIPERDALRVDQPFRVEVELFSTAPSDHAVTLDAQLGKLPKQTQTLTLSRGENHVQLEVTPERAGTLPFTLRFSLDACDPSASQDGRFSSPDCPDGFISNNQHAEKLSVSDRPHILYAIGSDARGSDYLRRALEGDDSATGKFRITTQGLPSSADDFDRYDVVIMADLPMYDAKTQRSLVGFSQLAALEQYVRGGGGLIAIGGEQSFGLGGYQDTALERILPIQFKADLDDPKSTSALALVIDRSGSMRGRPMEMAKESAKKAVEALKRNDRVMVIGFHHEPTTFVSLQPAMNRLKINNGINSITPSGETNIEAALESAYLGLALAPARTKHVILLTDGRAAYGSISQLVRQMRSERITVSTIGFGTDIDRVLLRQIADLGGGRSYFTTDLDAVPRIFLDETNTVTRNAIIEEPFKPQVVKKHALIKGVDLSSAPDLLGFVATKAKAGADVILRDPNKKAPILATWRFGLGKAVAFTSDAKNRWASAWISSSLFPKFWTQIVRETMRRKDETFFEMFTSLRGADGVVTIDAIDDNDQFINGLLVFGRVIPPQSDPCTSSSACADTFGGDHWYCCADFAQARADRPVSEPGWDCGKDSLAADQCFQEVSLLQSAPGRYEASFPLDQFGAYSIEARLRKPSPPPSPDAPPSDPPADAPNDKASTKKDTLPAHLAWSRGTLTYPFPTEYFFLAPNRAVIDRAVEVTGGKQDPSPAEVFSNEGRESKRQTPLWKYFLFAAAFLMVFDVLFRRVRFWGKTSVPWSAVLKP